MLRTTASVTTKVYWERRLRVESRNLGEKIKILLPLSGIYIVLMKRIKLYMKS